MKKMHPCKQKKFVPLGITPKSGLQFFQKHKTKNMNLRMMKSHTSLFLPLAAALAMVGSANAAVIASYVDGTDVDAAALTELAGNADVTASNLTASGFSGGDLITRPSFGVDTPAGPTAGSSAGSEWLFARSRNFTGTSSTTPGFTDDYFGFTVTAANLGETLDLNTLKFDFVAVVDNATGQPAANLSLEGKAQAFINVDGGGFNPIGAEVIASSSAPGDGSPSHIFGTVSSALIDLSSITGATSVEIRIGLGDDKDLDGNATFVQGIQLDGTVVPGGPPDPEITSITIAGDSATVVMTGAAGTDYYCAGSADLVDWTTEIVPTDTPLPGSPFQTDASGDLTFTVDISSLGSRYFLRVQDTDPSP